MEKTAKISINRPELFRPSSDPPPFKWPIWLNAMKCYFEVSNITESRQKIVHLANNLGPLALAEYMTGNQHGNAIEDTSITYENFINDCEFLFHTRPSPVRAHFQFNRARRDESESIQVLISSSDFGSRL